MGEFDKLIAKGKKASKKKAKKKPKKKAATKTATAQPPAVVPDTSSKVASIASEMEVRQFVREWAKCGWDAMQAVARIHPELKPKEIPAVANNYRNSNYLQPAIADVLHEVMDRSTMTQPEAEAVLTSHAMTSVLDFLDDDGRVIPIAEMRRLPRRAQLAIKKLKVSRTQKLDKDGNVEETTTHAEVELYDSQNAIEKLARLRQWGFSEGERDLAEMLKKAEARLHREPIDIEAIDPED